ncbi:MAG: T9SS type A sorting domain-containing protein [Candidatus Zixiibacteriota bacterium]
MKKALVLFFASFVLLGVGIPESFSRTELPQALSQESDAAWVMPNVQYRVHTASNLWLCISNWGFLGSQWRELSDPETGLPLPSSPFPGGSDLEYLFQGGIWIGAVVNDTPYVSVALDGWEWTYELYPDSGVTGSIGENEWWGDQEFVAVYADTLVPDWGPYPPPDERHRPLGVKIVQHSYGWETPGYNEFILLDYTIENIGGDTLYEPYVGFYMDVDIAHVNENPYGSYGPQDDITGFLTVHQGDTVNIAWAADNDGHGSEDGGITATEFTEGKSPTAVVGMKLLDASTQGVQLSRNWWFPWGAGLPRDWGPWKHENQGIWAQEDCNVSGDSLFPEQVLGTPGSHCAKYFLMSNGEIDYDQILSCVDLTEGDWLPPNASLCADFANGWDTRFLFSFGPFETLYPGDSLNFAVAWIAGDSFHVDPTNLAQDPDMTNPERFYLNLNFSKLVENSQTALAVYQSGYTLPPPGSPKNLRLTATTDSTVSLSWSPKPYHSLLGYNLYRSTVPGEYDDPPINGSVITDTVFEDTGLHATEVVYYSVASVDTSYAQGALSSDLEITVGRPSVPTGLAAESQKDMVTVSWQHNPEGDVIGYKIYRTEDCSTYVLVDSVGWQSLYWDLSVVNGTIYYYRIAAVDSTQLESFPSDTVWALPMAFDQGLAVLDFTNAKLADWDFQYGDSVDAFYSRALQSYEFDVIHHDSCPPPESRVSLLELSPHPVCIAHIEDLWQLCPLLDENSQVVLRNYLRSGGKLIIEGRSGLLRDLGIFYYGCLELTTYLSWFEFEYDYLRLEVVCSDPSIPPSDIGCQFVGARSELAGYPDLDVDTTRVNASMDSASYQLDGKLPGISYVIPQDWREVVYSYHSAYPDTSSYEGMPVAIRHLGPDHQVIFFCFPLYFIQEDQATQLLHQALADLGMYPTGFESAEGEENTPRSFSLKQNYPNPFNPETIIEYNLPEGCQVEIVVYNILGQKVRTLLEEYQKAGRHRVLWDGKDEKGRDVSSGIYLYRIKTSEFAQTKKMVLLR